MPDPALQDLLDADKMGTGIRISDRVDSADGVISNYYVTCNGAAYPGKSRWVAVTAANTDAQKNTAIRAALIV